MKKNILFVFLLFLMACVPKVQEPPILKPRPYDVKNDELIQFTDSFTDKLREAGQYYIHESKFNILFVEFGTVEWAQKNPNRIGECEKFWVGSQSNIVRRIIRINPIFWSTHKDNFASKEELMYHELGHCILDRGHNDNLLPNSPIAYSIMNSYHIGPQYYEANYSEYMKELFGVYTSNFEKFIAARNIFNGGIVYASEFGHEVHSIESLEHSEETSNEIKSSLTTCEH